VLFSTGGKNGRARAETTAPRGTWLGLVGEGRPPVAVGERLLVVLKAPSLADRVARADGPVSRATERSWTDQALEQQKRLLSRLALQGVRISPEFTYTRVLNGFSAALDPRAVALLQRAPEVRGVYPVRAAYPAVSRFGKAMRGAAEAARPPAVALPGYSGDGVTIALLDTGVDRLSPYLNGRLRPGLDVVTSGGSAEAEPNPSRPSEVERHGTEMAGVLVGHGGRFGLRGLAPGARLLPIRIAGWQRDASGLWAVYGRTDQLIAGLEDAVDPDQDGDAHDGVRIAVLGVTEPYAAFTDGPSARAVNGALKLNTLVVVPAGNDGQAGPLYGSISGPAGEGALTVGGVDLRSGTYDVRVVVRTGLAVHMSRLLPLAGAVTPNGTLALDVGAPRPVTASRRERATGALPPPRLADFFDAAGTSRVAGKAALIRAGTRPEVAVENAARAGAYAILLYGAGLPAGALGLDENVSVPVVAIPRDVASGILGEVRSGREVTVAMSSARPGENATHGRVTEFSSRGLAFDGRVKPDLVAPAVSIPTSEPGVHDDGTARFGTVNGTSIAAAMIAGAGALLAQARPDLTASELKGVLTGSARRLAHDPVEAQGAGLVDVGAAAAAEVVAEPGTLALPPAPPHRRATRTVVLHNVSTRTLHLALGVGAATPGLSIRVAPKRLDVVPGRSAQITVQARRSSRDGFFEGALRIAPRGGEAVRVPWLVAPLPRTRLLSGICLMTAEQYAQQPGSCPSSKVPAFRPSDVSPGVLVLRAGRVISSQGRREVRPVGRLEIELKKRNGTSLGVLVQLRDLLPGQYAFGLTGRGPAGQLLRKGVYRLALHAAPPGFGRSTRASLRFRIRR
jgi:subtilisin family serine protease